MKQDLVTVFEAMNLAEAQLLATRLAEAGIKADIANTDDPLAALNMADQYPQVRVLPADEERARAVVAEFESESAADFEAELDEEEGEEE